MQTEHCVYTVAKITHQGARELSILSIPRIARQATGCICRRVSPKSARAQVAMQWFTRLCDPREVRAVAKLNGRLIHERASLPRSLAIGAAQSDDERQQAVLHPRPVLRIDGVDTQEALFGACAAELKRAIAEPQANVPSTGIGDHEAQHPKQFGCIEWVAHEVVETPCANAAIGGHDAIASPQRQHRC